MKQIFGVLIGVAGAVMVGLLVIDVKGWITLAARKLVVAAARLLPEPHRSRYAEEWEANILALEGSPLSVLALAVWTVLKAPQWRSKLRADVDSADEKGHGDEPEISGDVVDMAEAVLEALPRGRYEEAWALAREHLRANLPESTFRLWLEPLRLIGAREDQLILEAPEGIRAWVDRRYRPLMNEALATTGSDFSGVDLQPAGPVGRTTGAVLNPRLTFEKFVVGDGNRLAYAAALAVAEDAGETYNPLFLHGPPGLGKTHLLTAIAHHLQANRPDRKVQYATAESFTNDFVTALRTSGLEAFKARFRSLDVLVIDDVQFFQGKPATEEEFFHTFNALYESGSQLVLSANRQANELSSLAARLRDRFEGGLSVPIKPLDRGTRAEILRRWSTGPHRRSDSSIWQCLNAAGCHDDCFSARFVDG